MNRSYFALFVALLIHFTLLLIIWLFGAITPDIKKPVKPKEHKIKVSLKEMPKKFKDSGQRKKTLKQPQKIAPPMPKGKQLKQIEKTLKRKSVKKPYIKYNTKKIKKTAAVKKKIIKPDVKQIEEVPILRDKPINLPKPKPKPPQKPKIALIPPSKPYISLPKKEDNKKYDSYAWLSEDKSVEEVKEDKKRVAKGTNINSNIKELYGDEFGKLSPSQQKYILDNQEIMRRITQQVLNRVARVNLTKDLNINRVNVIEFYLHPNGDMTNFKFLKLSGYYILDDTTKETIEYAYSRYPRPKEKTLIRYNVFYNLAHY